MEGIYSVLAGYLAEAITLAVFLGLVTRVGNIFVRVATGKEDWL